STSTHLASCGGCQREAVQLRRLHGLLVSNLTPAQPDWTGFWQGVVRGIEDQREARPVPAPRGWWPAILGHRWAFGGGLVAALLLTIGVWQYSVGVRPSEAGVLVTSAATDDPRARRPRRLGLWPQRLNARPPTTPLSQGVFERYPPERSRVRRNARAGTLAPEGRIR